MQLFVARIVLPVLVLLVGACGGYPNNGYQPEGSATPLPTATASGKPLHVDITLTSSNPRAAQLRDVSTYVGAWNHPKGGYILNVSIKVAGGTPPYLLAFPHGRGDINTDPGGTGEGTIFVRPGETPAIWLNVDDSGGKKLHPDRAYTTSEVAPAAPRPQTSPTVVINGLLGRGSGEFCKPTLTASVPGETHSFRFFWSRLHLYNDKEARSISETFSRGSVVSVIAVDTSTGNVGRPIGATTMPVC